MAELEQLLPTSPEKCETREDLLARIAEMRKSKAPLPTVKAARSKKPSATKKTGKQMSDTEFDSILASAATEGKTEIEAMDDFFASCKEEK